MAMLKNKTVNLLLFFLLLTPIPVSAVKYGPEEVVAKYISAVISGDYNRAETYWVDEVVAKSRRLGIEYIAQPVKYDCASPIMLYLYRIANNEIQYDIQKTTYKETYAAVPVRLAVNTDTLEYVYNLVERDGRWRLTLPFYLEQKDWQVIESEYTRLHYSGPEQINNYAISRLDEFIEQIGRFFKISKKKMKRLRNEKIDYYLHDEEVIEHHTGHHIHGITNLQIDAIMTCYLPHYHELIHFLFNYSMEDLPLYTLPFIQEGLAVALGGRWNKKPEVVMQIGYTALMNDISSPDDILTYRGFYNAGSPDVSYSLSGIFVKMLLDEYGLRRFKELYLSLSGSPLYIQSLTRNKIILLIESACRDNWPDIRKRFAEYVGRYHYSGLVPGGTGDGKPIIEKDSDNFELKIAEKDDFYEFSIRNKVGEPNGIILLDNVNLTESGDYKSRMYIEHLPDREYHGEDYGIKFDINEAGLYNYLTNVLTAKYVEAFSPDESYLDKKSNTVRFRLSRTIIENLENFRINIIKPDK